MHLFWLTKCIGQSFLGMVIVWIYLAIAMTLGCKVMVVMALSDYTRLSVKRLQVFFACAMIFLFYINVIAPEIWWYMISIFYSWPSGIRFESYLLANIILCNLILLLFASEMETVPISSIWITYPTAVTKLILFALRLLNSFQSL